MGSLANSEDPDEMQQLNAAFHQGLHCLLKLQQKYMYIIIYTDPKWKLYVVFKSIDFDDKLSFGANFFSHLIFNALSMSWKKLLDENH